MLDIFARTIMTATRTDHSPYRRDAQQRGRAHWPASERFDTGARARIEAHRIGFLRD